MNPQTYGTPELPRTAKAIQRSYQYYHLPRRAEVLAIAEKWYSCRSVATRYLFSAAVDGPDSPSAAASTEGRSNDLQRKQNRHAIAQ